MKWLLTLFSGPPDAERYGDLFESCLVFEWLNLLSKRLQNNFLPSRARIVVFPHKEGSISLVPSDHHPETQLPAQSAFFGHDLSPHGLGSLKCECITQQYVEQQHFECGRSEHFHIYRVATNRKGSGSLQDAC